MTEIKIVDGSEPFDHEKSAEEVIAYLHSLQAENERLRAGIKTATAALWSWIYSIKSRRITDIHDDLKSLVKKNG